MGACHGLFMGAKLVVNAGVYFPLMISLLHDCYNFESGIMTHVHPTLSHHPVSVTLSIQLSACMRASDDEGLMMSPCW